MQKIVPHLWFNQQAEEATHFYLETFENSKILNTTHYTEAGFEIHGMQAETVLTVDFELAGYQFTAINAGPEFTFTPAISFFVNCPTTKEVDVLWNKLSQGGTALMPLDAYPFSERYGWIQDQYGVTWQLMYSDMTTERHIVPSLLFTGDQCGHAEDAIKFYTSFFPNSEIGSIFRYGEGQEPDKEGTVMYADFTLAEQKFAVMDSAHPHEFTFNEAISFLIKCDTQDEIDFYWNKLSADPSAGQCGWLKDKFTVSWQVVPTILGDMLNESNKNKVNQVMKTLFTMKKINIEELKKAFE